MNIYLSALSYSHINNLIDKNKNTNINILEAFDAKEYRNQKIFNILTLGKSINSIMIDSGTYTLNSGNHKGRRDILATVDNYIIFANNIANDVDFFINFDYSFEPESLYLNEEIRAYMMRKGVNSMPVMHSFDKSEIKYMISIQNSHIAISRKLLGKKKKAIEVIEELYNNGKKVHLLGCTALEFLSKTKAWSSDSSSAIQHAKNRQGIFYSDSNNKSIIINFNREMKNGTKKDNYILGDKKLFDEYEHYISNGLGMTIDDLMKDINNNLVVTNAYYYCDIQERITKIQSSNGVKFDF